MVNKYYDKNIKLYATENQTSQKKDACSQAGLVGSLAKGTR